jgi:CheY-like chemotaxis protein
MMLDVNRPTILIVDDDPVIVDLLSSLLEDNYAIITAYDGAMALRLLQEQRPDLIRLDLMMPGVDGFTVARRVHEIYTDGQLPVLVLSAHPNLNTQAQRLHVDHFMTKPFEPDELLAAVAQLV